MKWGEDLFKASSTFYDNDIALLSAALSTAAYNGSQSDGYYIYNAYNELGFKDENISLYSYPGHRLNNPTNLSGMNDDSLSFSIASMSIKYGNLLVITLRGTKNIPFSMDFINDINADSTDFLGVKAHKGFYTFFTDVQRALLDYAEQHPAIESGNLKILVTGHSLGAAGANLLGAWFNNPRNNWALQSDVFAYTFASPNTYCGKSPDVGECSNIFNIVHEEDPVPKLPFANNALDAIFNPWKKFGTTKSFNTGEFVLGVLITKAMKFHPPKVYINAVEQKLIAQGSATGIGAVVACPVDVEVYDKTGAIVGRVTNNIVDVSVSKILLHVIDDVKYIFLPNEDGYSMKLNATDNGNMTYGVWKYSYESNEPLEQKVFQNVSLSPGKQMTSDIVGGVAVPDVKLLVLDTSGTPVKEVLTNGTEQTYVPLAVKWWQNLPSWLQWILRYVFFGWIWM